MPVYKNKNITYQSPSITDWHAEEEDYFLLHEKGTSVGVMEVNGVYGMDMLPE